MKLVNCGCGGEAQTGKSYSGFYSVECMNCGMQSGYYDTESEAITAWNQAMSGFVNDTNVVSKVAKVLNQARISRYSFGECGACGAPVIKPDKYCSECGAKLEWSDDE